MFLYIEYKPLHYLVNAWIVVYSIVCRQSVINSCGVWALIPTQQQFLQHLCMPACLPLWQVYCYNIQLLNALIVSSKLCLVALCVSHADVMYDNDSTNGTYFRWQCDFHPFPPIRIDRQLNTALVKTILNIYSVVYLHVFRVRGAFFRCRYC